MNVVIDEKMYANLNKKAPEERLALQESKTSFEPIHATNAATGCPIIHDSTLI